MRRAASHPWVLAVLALHALAGRSSGGLVDRFWRAGSARSTGAHAGVRLHVQRRDNGTGRAGGLAPTSAPFAAPKAHAAPGASGARGAQAPVAPAAPTAALRVSTRAAPSPPQSPAAGSAARFLLEAADPFQCRECAAGTYCFRDALARCPEHADSQNRSDNIEDCVCRPGFAQNASWATGGACAACAPGFYCAGGNASVACPPGSRSPAGAASEAGCACLPGFTAGALGAQGAACTACAAGSAKADAGPAPCAGCLSNTYAESASATCSQCPTLTVSDAGAGALAQCVAAPGAFGPAGAAAQLCTPGSYQPLRGQEACLQCPVDHYQDEHGATFCRACPVNTQAPAGAAALAACVAAPGFFGAPGSAAAPCAAGSFSALPAQSACLPCPAGEYQPQAAATACRACPAASVSPEGAAAADACVCLAGHAREDTDPECAGCPAFRCGACAPGTFAALAGASACSACAPGEHQPASGQSACLDCPQDTYAGPGAPACTSCGAHEVAPARSGPGVCRCRGGFARNAWQLGQAGGLPQLLHLPNPDGDADGDADCVACLPGYYRDFDESASAESASPAAAHCQACPQGFVTPLAASASATECALCDVGSYVVSTGEGRFCRPCMQYANTSFEFLGAFDEQAADAVDHPDSPLFRETIGLCRCATGFERRASAGAAAALAALDAGFTGFSIAEAQALEGNLSCAPCVAGKFKTAPGNAPCAACPAGTGPAPAEIILLLPGGVRALPEDACVECPARTFSRLGPAEDGGEVFECVVCPANAGSAPGSTAPGNCSCDSGHAFAGAGLACEPCAAGTFKPAGDAACTRCAPGAYALGAASACTACPANSTTNGDGAASSTACVCAPGYFGAGATCALCPPGSFTTTLGAAACEDCGPTHFLAPYAAIGQRACVPCPANSTAIPRALGVQGCVALGGFVRLAGAGARVALEVFWPHAAAGLLQPAFERGVTAASVSGCSGCTAAARVTRAAAATTARRRSRRLLTEGVVIALEISVPDLQAGGQLIAALSVESINAGLATEDVPPISNIISGPTLLTTEASFGQCPADSYCPSQELVIACPPNSSAAEGSSSAVDCACVPGFFGGFAAGAPAGACTLCPVDSFCPGGALARPCAANSSTVGRVGSAAPAACECGAGFYRAGAQDAPEAQDAPDGFVCVVCPADSFCADEQRVECPAASAAPRGAPSADACECQAGTFRTPLAGAAAAAAAASGEAAFECSPCPPTSVCHAGGAIEVCAADASNVNFACRCAAGKHCLAPNASFGFGPSCDNRTRCAPCARAEFCDSIAAHACAPGEDAPPLSTSRASCRCEPGFYRTEGAGAPCAPCDVGFACPGGVADRLHAGATWLALQLHASEARAAVALFDPFLTTPGPRTLDISHAVCQEGFFRTSRQDTCKLCPKNFWCPPENADSALPNVIACLENEVTEAPGASAADECFCAAGFKVAPQDAVTRCEPCKAGERCQAGEVVEAQCHAMKRVPNADHSKCVCDVGHGEYQLSCSVCPPGTSKPFIGDAPCAFCEIDEYIVDPTGPCLPCPAHSSSRPGSTACTCAAPFVWVPGIPGTAGTPPFCALCPDDFFWASATTPPSRALPLGTGAPPGLCLACPAESRSNASAAMPAGIPACRCAAGRAAVPELPRNISLLGENVTTLHPLLACSVCEAGRFEDNGVCRRCAENATTAPGETGAAACVCDVAAPADRCRTQRVEGSCFGACADVLEDCTACPAGLSKPEFSATGNTDTCALCAIGFFQPEPGSPACEACPAHETTLLTGRAALADCRCVAGYARAAPALPADGFGPCVPCAPGHFKPGIGDEPCLVCGEGRFQPAPNATACASCAAATASLSAFAVALAAEGGNASHPVHPALEANATHAETSVSVLDCVCAVGHEPRTEAALAAELAALAALAEGEPEGATPAALAIAAAALARSAERAPQRCAACRRGAFKPGIGLAACFYCGRGDIPGVGGSALNHYGDPVLPGDDFRHCVPCPAHSGQEAALVGPDFPMDAFEDCKCFPGFEQRTALSCSICPAHMVQPQYSDADCAFCPAGHYYVARQYPCVLCDLVDEDNHERHQGRLANSLNLSLAWGVAERDCLCRRGYERLAESNTCTKCRAGSFHADAFDHLCSACAPDSYQPAEAALACLACPPHSTTLNASGAPALQRCVCDPGREALLVAEDGAASCPLCPAGKYRSERAANFEVGPSGAPAATACILCPADSFCPEGSVVPQPCAPREVSLPGSTAPIDCQCSTGRGRPAPDAPCEDCAHAFFSPGRTNAPCQPCPAHKNTSAPAASAIEHCACVPGHGVPAEAAPDQPCAPCADGYFARGGRNQSCVHCGFGAVTEPPSAATAPAACMCDARLGLGLEKR